MQKITLKKVSQVSIIFLLALSLRIFYLSLYVQPEYLIKEDQSLYISLSEKIDLYQWTTWEKATTERTIGYPVFLAFVKNQLKSFYPYVLAVQSLIDSATCIMIYLVARTLSQNGTIAGFLAASNLNMIIFSGMLLTECLFLFFLTCFIYSYILSWKNRNVYYGVVSIFFLTFATFFRSASYYLIFPAVLTLFGYFYFITGFRNAAKLVLLSCLCFFFVLGPRHLRNFVDFHSASFETQGGAGVLFWYFPGAYQLSGQGSYGDGEESARKKLRDAMEKDFLTDLPHNPFQKNRYLLTIGRKALSDLGFISLAQAWMTGAIINLVSPSIANAPAVRAIPRPSFYYTPGKTFIKKVHNYFESIESKLYFLLLSVSFIFSLIFLGFSLWGFSCTLSSNPSMADKLLTWTLGAVVFYFLLITGPIISPKYRLPTEPILIVFASAGLERLMVIIAKKSRKGL